MVGAAPDAVAIGDMDGVGFRDVMTSNRFSANYYVLSNPSRK